MSLQDEFLRKAAVLIATLDDQAAESLLDLLGREQSLRLQHMLSELAPVTLDERSSILHEFLHANEARIPPNQDAEGVEVDDSLAAKIASADTRLSDDEPLDDPPQPAGAIAESSRFAFLLDAEPEVVGDLLAGEHAQTISVVLSYLPSVKAAEAAQQLPIPLRREVIERLGRLQATDDAIAEEIAQQLKRRLEQRMRESARSGEKSASPTPTKPQREATTAHSRPNGTSPPSAAKDNAKSSPHCENLPGFEFDDLNTLADHALAMVFQRAEPRVALIALTGASPGLSDRIQRQLPWREARELRHQIERLGPIRLSDVEHAQRKLAETAATLIRDRMIPPPKNRRFTTAA